ncbi:hypothetical protein EVAR_63619_1 [Eumeta japonica]|uniref:Pre-C2HC domain-containing protein n=1 Tax=Eumeta variegata TaxID=151549 RepID=A0A4C1ZQ66_EUMVA|nr:hypothetical protein EVAR_63619_1 [Eumeta japonica]
MSSIDDFRKLNSYLIKSDIPFHTYALEEERKVKAVLKGVPVEIDTEDIKADLVRQEYPVQAVHRMHRRDGTALGIPGSVIAASFTATRPQTVTPPRCVKCWIHIGPRNVVAPAIQKANLPAATAVATIQLTTEGARQRRNPNRKVAIIKIVQKSIRHHVRWTYPTTKQRKQTDSTDSADETYRKQKLPPPP